MSAEGSSRKVAHRDAEHQGQLTALFGHHLMGSIDGHLGIQRVEDGLDEQHVHTAFHQRLYLFVIGGKELVVGQFAGCGIADVTTHRTSLVRGSHGAADPSGMLLRSVLIGHRPGYPCTFESHLAGKVFQMIVGLADALAAEGIGCNQVCTGLQITAVNLTDDAWARQVEHVVVARHHTFHLTKPLSAEVTLLQLEPLNLSSHCSVEYQNALLD